MSRQTIPLSAKRLARDLHTTVPAIVRAIESTGCRADMVSGAYQIPPESVPIIRDYLRQRATQTRAEIARQREAEAERREMPELSPRLIAELERLRNR